MTSHGGKREPGLGKKLGRPRVLPEIPGPANKGIASRVLAKCDEVQLWLDFIQPAKPIDEMSAAERFDRRFTLEYLTNKRDGKPAQGVFVGDTRENARELDFGDLPDLVAASKSLPAGKPN